MKVCCIEGCDGPSKEDPMFFDFPTSRTLRKKWLDAIDSSTKVPQDAVVCIRHFSSQDYVLVRGKTRLRSKVIPTLQVGKKHDDREVAESTQQSAEYITSDRTAPDNTEKTTLDNKDNDKEKGHNDNENNGKINNHNEEEKVSDNTNDNKTINDGNGSKKRLRSDRRKDQIGTKNGHNEVENDTKLKNRPDNENDTRNNDERLNNDNEKVDNDNEKFHNEHEKVNQDNEKGNNDNEKIQTVDNSLVKIGRKTRCKITAKRVVHRRKDSSQSSDSSEDSVSSSPPHKPEIDGNKEDIEEALTNYYIENKKTERQVAAMADVLQEELEKREEKREEVVGVETFVEFQPSEPVFIELSVGQGPGTDNQGPAENDCLMVLESVQCDVDPALLLASREMEEEADVMEIDDDDDDDGEQPPVKKKKEDPISLLTSSDEDDVIIEEPHIDTVEVSSADTSEDDMPLVKLVKTSKRTKTKKQSMITKLLWGASDFYCVHCRFTTLSAAEYTKHMTIHSKVLQLCPDCGFTTCSKAQMLRHKQKHKNERRYKCTLCNYSAKHEMSLIYHMRTHKGRNDVELAICDTFRPLSGKSAGKSSGKSGKRKSIEKRYNCPLCKYTTKRRSDLRRHQLSMHDDENDGGDETP